MEKIKSELRGLLTKKRYEHTLGVEESAIELANRYDADIEKVRKAALLHDCSKQFELKKMQELCECEEMLENYGDIGELLHGFAGSVYANKTFGIEDEEILDAIKYHSIGRKGMSLIEKIVYLADAIEPNRDYPQVGEIRRLAKTNLNNALLYEIDKKLEFLIAKKVIIHPNTVEMRNEILSEIKSSNKEI